MLKKKDASNDQATPCRYPNRNTLAEIRQSYLMRQPMVSERYPTGKKPVNIKPDYYDYVPSMVGHKTYNKFTIERPTLPYYVVPVLYVPQKVLSTEDIRNTLGRPLLNKPTAATEYLDGYQAKITRRKVKQQHLVDAENYGFSDSECDEGVMNQIELDGKSITYARRSNSGSTINDQSSVSTPLDDISESHMGAKNNYPYTNSQLSNYKEKSISPLSKQQPFVGTDLYKYPISQKAFQNFYRPTILPISNKYRYPEMIQSNPTEMYHQYNLMPKKQPSTTKNEYGDCKDAFTKPNQQIESKIEQKSYDANATNFEENFDDESVCSHSHPNSQNDSKHRKKICIDCLKTKYLINDQTSDYNKEKLDYNNPNLDNLDNLDELKEIEDPQSYTYEDEFSIRSTNSKPHREQDSDPQSSRKTVLADTKSTQTTSVAKTTMGIQTDLQEDTRRNKHSSKNCPEEDSLRSSLHDSAGYLSNQPKENKNQQQIKQGKVSQIPQRMPQDYRALYADMARHNMAISRISYEQKMNKRKKKEDL